jgi:hypothetical protein
MGRNKEKGGDVWPCRGRMKGMVPGEGLMIFMISRFTTIRCVAGGDGDLENM